MTSIVEALCALPIHPVRVRIESDGERGRVIASTSDAQICAAFEGFAELNQNYDGRICRIAQALNTPTAKLLGAQLVLSGDGAQYSFAPTDLPVPSLLEPEQWSSMTVSARELKRAIQFTEDAAAKNDIRYYLNGIHMQVGDGCINFEASNGHVAARYTMPSPEADAFDIILASEATATFVGLLKRAEGDVLVETGCRRHPDQDDVAMLRISVGDVSVTGIGILGKYPVLDQVIHSGEARCLGEYEGKRALESLNRLLLLATSKMPFMKMKVSDGHITLGLTACESAATTEMLPPQQTIIHDAVDTAVNPYYLKDAMAAMNTERILIGWSEANRPITIQPGEGDGSSLWLVMPQLS